MGSAVAVAVSVIVEPVGASSGTFEQAAVANSSIDRRACGNRRGIMETLNILKAMYLRGQAKAPIAQNGYAMAALLVAMAIMAVMMTVAMPVWRQIGQREKEEELVFRGQQWARAVGLFQRKYANAAPPNLDVLVQQRFVRKKYKDPITGKDFLPLLAGQAGANTGAGGQGGRGGGQPATGGQTAAGAQVGQPSAIGTPAGASGGVIGVVSESKATSIRVYNGRSHYNEWSFVFVPQVQQPGAGGAPGTGTPGQPGRGGQPNQPGGPGGGRNSNGPGRGGPGQGGNSSNPFNSRGVQDPFAPTSRPSTPTTPGAPAPRR